MLENRKLLSAQIILFKVFIFLNSCYILFFTLAIINRKYMLNMLNLEQAKLLSNGMAIMWISHQVLNVVSLILMISLIYRINKNLKQMGGNRNIYSIWIFLYWIVPFFEVIFPLHFFKRYQSSLEVSIKRDSKRFRIYSTLILIFGIFTCLIAYLFLVVPLLPHRFMYINGLLVYVKSFGSILYSVFWIFLWKQLKTMNDQLIAQSSQQTYISDLGVIDA